MKKYVVLDKPVGQTPLEALRAWKAANPAYEDISASYAGRLDPMASGKLLVLLGDECKRQKAYTGLDKEYEIEILLDVGSDTGDALGLITYSKQETRVDPEVLRTVLAREQGSHEREYPIFSSKPVDGLPLFLHALQGTINTISIPTHTERIHKIRCTGTREMSAKELQERIEAFLTKTPRSDEPSKELGADFRIGAVRASWEKVFAASESRSFAILSLRVTCGTGAYMRSLAGRIGEALGTKALALSIHRTKIGKYRFGMWWKKY